MSAPKTNIVRAIHANITRGVIDIREIAEITGKDVRTIQYYLDLTNDREFRASDVQKLSRHFAQMGIYNLAYRFLPESCEITETRIGKPDGNIDAKVTRLVGIGSALGSAKGDGKKMDAVIDELLNLVADLRAEHALIASREQRDD